MCELLGMNANVPTDICFSFSGLIKRGGATKKHADGWGITFFEDKGCRSFHDPHPSAKSEIAKFLRTHPIKSKFVVSHIRLANRGKVCLENTHPFIRELWGRYWTFAHNGELKGIKKMPLKFYKPVGTTDSEWAFCYILDHLRARYKTPPTNGVLCKSLHQLCKKLNMLGIFNMLLSNGEFLFAYCATDLSWITRKAPFGKATLIDEEITIDFAKETTPHDIVTVIATFPLTHDETWHKMKKGEFVAFKNGIHHFNKL